MMRIFLLFFFSFHINHVKQKISRYEKSISKKKIQFKIMSGCENENEKTKENPQT